MGEEVKIKFGVDGVSVALSEIKKLSGAIGDIAKGVVAEFAAPLAAIGSIAGVAEIAKQFQDYNIEIEKAMKFTGESAKEMAGLSYAAQRSDTSLESLQQGLKSFSKWLVETGQGEKNVIQGMMDQADFFQQLGDGAERNELAVQRFGKLGMELIPVLSRGSTALAELIERGKDLSGVSEASVQTAREYADSWTDLKVSLTGLAGTVAQKVQPALSELYEDWAGGAVMLRKLIDGSNEAAEAVTKIEPKKITGFWTETQLQVQNKMIDGQRESLVLLMQRRDMMTKGSNSYSMGGSGDAFHADMASLSQEADLIDKKLDNAAQALRQNAITKGQYDQINLETSKQLLAIDQQRQQIEQRDVSDNMKLAQEDIQRLQRASALIAANPKLSAATKQTDEIELLIAESERMATVIKGMKDTLPTVTDAMKPILQQGIDSATKEKGNIDQDLALKKMKDVPNTFKDQFGKVLQDMQTESAVTWQKIAQTMHTTVGTAINSLSENMTKIVMGTESWRQGLVSIGQAIETQIISKVISMAAEAVLEWLPAAILSSIASDGESAGTGLTAVLSAMAGFAEGGFTGAGGQYDVAGLVHRGEYVMPADTVQRLGLPAMQAIQSGAMPSGGGSGRVGSTEIHVHNWGPDEGRRMADHIRSHPEVIHALNDHTRKHYRNPRQA